MRVIFLWTWRWSRLQISLPSLIWGLCHFLCKNTSHERYQPAWTLIKVCNLMRGKLPIKDCVCDQMWKMPLRSCIEGTILSDASEVCVHQNASEDTLDGGVHQHAATASHSVTCNLQLRANHLAAVIRDVHFFGGGAICWEPLKICSMHLSWHSAGCLFVFEIVGGKSQRHTGLFAFWALITSYPPHTFCIWPP